MTKFRLAAGTAVLALAVAGVAAMAQSAEPLAAKFGARQSVLDLGISPEGKHVVFVAPRPDGGENAVVVSLETGDLVPILGAKGITERIGNCQFVIETHVVCSIWLREGSNQDVDAATRLVVLTADGKSMEQLTARTPSTAFYQSNNGGGIIDYNVPGNPRAVLMTRTFAEEARSGNLTGGSQAGLAVESVDIITLDRQRVESPRGTAFWYATDGKGNVRLLGTAPRRESGYLEGELNYSFRPQNGRGWDPLSTVTFVGNGRTRGFDPIAVDPDENVAYGLDNNGQFTALYKMALDGTGTKTLVLSRDGTDIDDLIRIGRNQRIVGATYATERRHFEFFDPELKTLAAALSRSLGGRQISFVDSTADENKLIVFAGSDTDPGKFYLYDKGTRELAFMMAARPELAGVTLGEMKPVQYPAADGTMIPAYLTLPPGNDGKNLPAIVMPHGGPHARDEWGFDWLSQYFVARGFAVLQPNYRGSAGFGAEWFQEGGWQSWPTAVGDVNSAGRWLVDQGIAAPGKLAIFGWSYGGYAALQSQVLDPGLFKAVVAVAPVTDLERLRQEFRGQSNRRIMEQFIGDGPHIEAGSPARHAASFQAPVLIFHGDTDLNVGVGQSRLMNDRLRTAGKQVTYVEFPTLDHQLDTTAARTRLLTDSDRFLRTALGL
jgi:dipeptidyl aminopeptidase/acylaminoacyl peptidase